MTEVGGASLCDRRLCSSCHALQLSKRCVVPQRMAELGGAEVSDMISLKAGDAAGEVVLNIGRSLNSCTHCRVSKLVLEARPSLSAATPLSSIWLPERLGGKEGPRKGVRRQLEGGATSRTREVVVTW